MTRSKTRSREDKLQYDRQLMSKIVQQRRVSNLCVNCGKPAREGKRQCQSCADYQTLRISERRVAFKRRAVEYLGGQCVDCGLLTDIIAVYDFHHRHPEEKSASINHLLTTLKNWARIQEELDKCELLCANCHRIRHASEE